MKTLVTIFIAFAFCYMIFDMFKQDKIIDNQETIITKIDSLNIKIDYINNHHLRNDSLYHAHLSECSFISHRQVKVDKNGYPYLANLKAWDIYN